MSYLPFLYHVHRFITHALTMYSPWFTWVLWRPWIFPNSPWNLLHAPCIRVHLKKSYFGDRKFLKPWPCTHFLYKIPRSTWIDSVCKEEKLSSCSICYARLHHKQNRFLQVKQQKAAAATDGINVNMKIALGAFFFFSVWSDKRWLN